jgi:hypothetical protein
VVPVVRGAVVGDLKPIRDAGIRVIGADAGGVPFGSGPICAGRSPW